MHISTLNCNSAHCTQGKATEINPSPNYCIRLGTTKSKLKENNLDTST